MTGVCSPPTRDELGGERASIIGGQPNLGRGRQSGGSIGRSAGSPSLQLYDFVGTAVGDGELRGKRSETQFPFFLGLGLPDFAFADQSVADALTLGHFPGHPNAVPWQVPSAAPDASLRAHVLPMSHPSAYAHAGGRQ